MRALSVGERAAPDLGELVQGRDDRGQRHGRQPLDLHAQPARLALSVQLLRAAWSARIRGWCT